jgi:uncharacterized membrane protein (DUF441 family)
MSSYLILFGLALLGYVAHNSTVTISALALIVMRAVLSDSRLSYFGSHGLNWGMILLTAAMITPIGINDILNVFKSPAGIASVVVGIVVAILGKWGVDVMTNEPQIVVSILVGTIIGVIFFKGVPVGPMIASGIFYMFLQIFTRIFGS